jgi:hypothetical protein
MNVDEQIAELEKEYPLVMHTNAGRLYSTVRRMKAEKERGIPIERRTGFAVSVKTGRAASKMTEQEWETFYASLCGELRRDYPESHSLIFSTPHRTPEELRFLQDSERLEGRPLSEQEANLWINQAIFIGDLPDHALDCPFCKLYDAG